MKLAEIPKILDLLVEESVITADQQTLVLQEIDTQQEKGLKAFAGETAIKLGFLTKDTLDHYLSEQTVRKAEAAVIDNRTIRDEGHQDAPGWLTANWGNNGVNPLSDTPTVADGISAVANIAQNIVMISNDHPELADSLQPALVASANLARGMIGGNNAHVPIDSRGQEWAATLKEGLVNAVEQSGVTPADKNGQPVSLDDFVAARFAEVEIGLQLSSSRGSEQITNGRW